MLTANTPALERISCVSAVLSTQTSTSIGSSDSDVTAFAVMPCSSPRRRVVMSVTPVAKRPIARRKSSCAVIPRFRGRASTPAARLPGLRAAYSWSGLLARCVPRSRLHSCPLPYAGRHCFGDSRAHGTVLLEELLLHADLLLQVIVVSDRSADKYI